MKLYANWNGKVTPFTINPSHSIGQLSQILSNTLQASSVNVSKFDQGAEIGPDVLVSSFFEPFDDVWVVKKEERKEAPSHLPPPAALQFISLAKYSFYEYDSNWVRVEVPFPGIGKHDKGKISCVFDVNSFVLKILEFGGKNYQFSVMRMQCNVQKELCKFAVLQDKIRISLRKVKENDNWFSLFKTKTIGGDD
jgi:hypothetical protein